MTVEVFTGVNCGYCEKAKALLERNAIAFRELDISGDAANRDELIRRLPRSKSIPQVFVDGEHIGGYEDLCHLDETGRLTELVRPVAGPGSG